MFRKGLQVSPRFLRRDIPMHASWLSCPPDQQCLVGTAGKLELTVSYLENVDYRSRKIVTIPGQFGRKNIRYNRV